MLFDKIYICHESAIDFYKKNQNSFYLYNQFTLNHGIIFYFFTTKYEIINNQINIDDNFLEQEIYNKKAHFIKNIINNKNTKKSYIIYIPKKYMLINDNYNVFHGFNDKNKLSISEFIIKNIIE